MINKLPINRTFHRSPEWNPPPIPNIIHSDKIILKGKVIFYQQQQRSWRAINVMILIRIQLEVSASWAGTTKATSFELVWRGKDRKGEGKLTKNCFFSPLNQHWLRYWIACYSLGTNVKQKQQFLNLSQKEKKGGTEGTLSRNTFINLYITYNLLKNLLFISQPTGFVIQRFTKPIVQQINNIFGLIQTNYWFLIRF